MASILVKHSAQKNATKFTEVADVTTDVLACETGRIGLSSEFLGSQFVCFCMLQLRELKNVFRNILGDLMSCLHGEKVGSAEDL